MGDIRKITISLPDEMLDEIRSAIDAGEFTNTSEAIRDALRHWRRARTVVAASDEELDIAMEWDVLEGVDLEMMEELELLEAMLALEKRGKG